jgi:hypothetical protein
MGLSITNKKGRGYPALTCDTCGLVIEDLGKGIAAFSLGPDGTVASVRIFHKGNCDPNVAGWMPLEHFVVLLLWNHKLGKMVHSEHGVKLTVEVPEMLQAMVDDV